MALLLQEGFDHYTSTANFYLKWPIVSGVTSVAATGRWPAQGSAIASYGIIGTRFNFIEASRPLGSQVGTAWLGFAVNINSLASFSILNPILIDSVSGRVQVSLTANIGGSISIRFSGALLSSGPNLGSTGTVLATTAPGVVSAGTWVYLELKVVYSTTATGSVALYINGSTTAAASATGVITASTNAWADTIALTGNQQSGGSGNTIDDLYVCDTTGAVNNTQLGDVKVVTTMPASAGLHTAAWAQTGGTTGLPATAVNEANPDGDTSYLSDSTPGDIQDFVQASAGTIGATLFGVSINAYARKDDAGTRVLGLGVGNGVTDSFDAGHALGSTYVCYTRCMSTNPLTSAAWAVSDPATLQSSIKEIS